MSRFERRDALLGGGQRAREFGDPEPCVGELARRSLGLREASSQGIGLPRPAHLVHLLAVLGLLVRLLLESKV